MKSLLLIAMAMMASTPALAQDVVYDIEDAYTNKYSDADVSPIYEGEIGYIDQVKVPWRTVSQGKWAREAAPEHQQASYDLTAQADYDADGKPDTARIYINGKQLAVIVTPGNGKPPMAIYKTDGIFAGVEIYGKRNRFVMTVPESGYIIMLMHKGKPALAFMGE